jgi:hypothetical protein
VFSSAYRWLIRHPGVPVFIAGAWIGVAPVALMLHVENQFMWSSAQPTGIYAVLWEIHNLPHAETAAVVLLFFGCGVASTGLCIMFR